MNIQSITIGGWFQRTTLHLTEIQSFLNGKDLIGLDKKVLQKNLKSIGVKRFERVADEIEYLEVYTNQDFRLKVFEDGLMTLKVDINTNDLKFLELEISKLKNYQ